MKKNQQGVGLIEVIVALVILAVAVLGFSAMQMRAVATSTEAANNVYATNIARDLAERLRVNREGLKALQGTDGAFSNTTSSKNCGTTTCNATEMAQYDYTEVATRATNLGMEMDVLPCQGMSSSRSCVYVAWGDTTPTNGKGAPHCTDDNSYVADAQCVIMEIYNNVN